MSQRIVSLDRAAVMLQVGMAITRGAAEAVGVQPALVINGIEHYDELDLPRIQNHLREQAEKRRQPQPPAAKADPPEDYTSIDRSGARRIECPLVAGADQAIEPRRKKR